MSDNNFDYRYISINNVAPVKEQGVEEQFNLHAVTVYDNSEVHQTVCREELERLASGHSFYGHTINLEEDKRSIELLRNALELEVD